MDNPARITRAACHGMQVATQPRGPAIRACEWRVHVMLPAIPGRKKKSWLAAMNGWQLAAMNACPVARPACTENCSAVTAKRSPVSATAVRLSRCANM